MLELIGVLQFKLNIHMKRILWELISSAVLHRNDHLVREIITEVLFWAPFDFVTQFLFKWGRIQFIWKFSWIHCYVVPKIFRTRFDNKSQIFMNSNNLKNLNHFKCARLSSELNFATKPYVVFLTTLFNNSLSSPCPI